MKYINLLGEEIDSEEVHKKLRAINPMVKAYGNGPTEFRCKHCKFFFRKRFSKHYFKCEYRGNTNGPKTDHKANWPTCGKFQIDVLNG